MRKSDASDAIARESPAPRIDAEYRTYQEPLFQAKSDRKKVKRKNDLKLRVKFNFAPIYHPNFMLVLPTQHKSLTQNPLFQAKKPGRFKSFFLVHFFRLMFLAGKVRKNDLRLRFRVGLIVLGGP